MSTYCIAILRNGNNCTAIARYGDLCGIHKKIDDIKIDDNDIKIDDNDIKIDDNDMKIDDNDMKIDDISRKNRNLLINKTPNLIKEWDLEKNNKLNIDINDISFSSHKKVYWKCLKNIEHESYYASPNSKPKEYGCPECGTDALRVHDKKVLEKHKNSIKPIRNTTLIGDETENYVKELLIDSNQYKNVDVIGNMGGSGDILIEHSNNIINYIQVKTLTHNRNDIYYISNDKKYSDNMLIVMVNKERTRFALEYAGNIKVKKLSLVYDYKKSKYLNIMYKNENDFLSNLIKMIPHSCLTNNINESISKEINMMDRFKYFCEKNNINFLLNKTNGNSIDGYINGYSFQGKYVSKPCRKNCFTYGVSFCKSAGRINYKNVSKNYEIGDFDFAVIEVGGDLEEPEKYLGNFCIIPVKTLIEQKIMKSETCKGKKGFQVCPPFNYWRNHWSKNFWNNIISI